MKLEKKWMFPYLILRVKGLVTWSNFGEWYKFSTILVHIQNLASSKIRLDVKINSKISCRRTLMIAQYGTGTFSLREAVCFALKRELMSEALPRPDSPTSIRFSWKPCLSPIITINEPVDYMAQAVMIWCWAKTFMRLETWDFHGPTLPMAQVMSLPRIKIIRGKRHIKKQVHW